jgi:hypothetical protein
MPKAITTTPIAIMRFPFRRLRGRAVNDSKSGPR